MIIVIILIFLSAIVILGFSLMKLSSKIKRLRNQLKYQKLIKRKMEILEDLKKDLEVRKCE